jgi:hypothetical protein
MADKKELKVMFRDFLINLETFLNASALKIDEDLVVFVLYLQEPEEYDNSFYAKGLVQIGRYISPIKIEFIIDVDDIEIKSKFFTYHLTTKEMKEFLDQIRR